MDRIDTTSDTAPSGDLTRRDLIKGAAASGIIVGADEYVKPALRVLGITRLAGATSTPPGHLPPPPAIGHGCTPGFWGNNSSGAQGGGVEWWNSANDPQWAGHGGNGTNPFSHGASFNSFFTPASELSGMSMWEVVNGGGGPNAARACARQLVAAYLNASFGGFGFTTTALRNRWTAATNASPDAARGAALRALQASLELANLRCDSN